MRTRKKDITSCGDVPSQDVKIRASSTVKYLSTESTKLHAKLTLFHQTTCQACAIEKDWIKTWASASNKYQ